MDSKKTGEEAANEKPDEKTNNNFGLVHDES